MGDTGISVLIADDSPDIVKIMQMVMSLRDYDCYTAKDGRQAMAILSQQSVQLLITDMMMPNVDGIELIMYAKKQYPDIKIIAMSAGYEMPEELEAQRYTTLQSSIAYGADYLLKKPFEVEDIYTSIDTVMQVKS